MKLSEEAKNLCHFVLLFLICFVLYKAINIADILVRRELFYSHEEGYLIGHHLETKDLRDFFEDAD